MARLREAPHGHVVWPPCIIAKPCAQHCSNAAGAAASAQRRSPVSLPRERDEHHLTCVIAAATVVLQSCRCTRPT